MRRILENVTVTGVDLLDVNPMSFRPYKWIGIDVPVGLKQEILSSVKDQIDLLKTEDNPIIKINIKEKVFGAEAMLRTVDRAKYVVVKNRESEDLPPETIKVGDKVNVAFDTRVHQLAADNRVLVVALSLKGVQTT